ncbi:hypothetical protein D9M71_824490 [compost metagenome]
MPARVKAHTASDAARTRLRALSSRMISGQLTYLKISRPMAAPAKTMARKGSEISLKTAREIEMAVIELSRIAREI